MSEISKKMLTSGKEQILKDAYVLATARRLKVKILTGDAHFKPPEGSNKDIMNLVGSAELLREHI